MDAKSTIVLDKQPEKAAPTEVLKKGDEAQSFDAEKIKLLESFSSADDIVKQLKEFASAKAEIEKLKKAQETMKRESFKKEVDSFAANLVEEKKLLPKHRELVKGIMFALDESKTVEFEKEFGKKEKESLIEVFKYFLSSLPEHGLLTTFAQNSALTDRQEALEAFWKLKGLTPDDVKKMDENRFKSFLIEFERKRAEFADAAKH